MYKKFNGILITVSLIYHINRLKYQNPLRPSQKIKKSLMKFSNIYD